MGREYRIPITQGLMGAAVRSRQTVLVNDVLADPRFVSTPGMADPLAELAIPILLGDRVLGVLNIESDDPLNADDAAGLRVVADQLAVAIENARLYAAAQQVAVLRERQRLARDLHDSVTQLLFSMTLIAQAIGPAWRRDAADGERHAARLLELSQLALTEMRALVAGSRGSEPPADAPVRAGASPALSVVERVRRDGLVTALREHAAEVSRDGPPVALRADGYAPQPPACEEALFRITQEALNNVVKHARARRARVSLATGPAGTRLTIRDDGVGFSGESGERAAPPSRGGVSGGFGLATMRERARECGGDLRVVSTPGRGTAVHVTIPPAHVAGR
jgi:signal transduction histidine kinase